MAFSLLAMLTLWRQHSIAAGVLFALGGLLIVSGVAVPTRLGPVQRFWMALAHAISRVTTPVFMGAVFFLVLTPAGLLRRSFARNPLRHERQDGSYWVTRRAEQRTDLERQF
jgi:hypothetical protein